MLLLAAARSAAWCDTTLCCCSQALEDPMHILAQDTLPLITGRQCPALTKPLQVHRCRHCRSIVTDAQVAFLENTLRQAEALDSAPLALALPETRRTNRHV